MRRWLFLGGVGLLAVLVGLIVLNALQSPVAARELDLESTLASIETPPAPPPTTPGLSYAELEHAITGNPRVWKALIDAPPPVKKTPDLAGMLKGVQVTRDVMGSGESMKVRIRTPQSRRAAWKGKGDVVAGLTIESVTAESVTFILVSNGDTYRHSVPVRPR